MSRPRKAKKESTGGLELPGNDEGLPEWELWGFESKAAYEATLMEFGPDNKTSCCRDHCMQRLSTDNTFITKQKAFEVEFEASSGQKQDLIAFNMMKESEAISKAIRIESCVEHSSPLTNTLKQTYSLTLHQQVSSW